MDTATPEVVPEQDTKTRRQPPYAVILHNDDKNTMEFVVGVLRRVFGYTLEKCVRLMLEAHKKGKSAVWIGALEVAELKADPVEFRNLLGVESLGDIYADKFDAAMRLLNQTAARRSAK